MRYQRFGDRYVVGLESGEPVVEVMETLGALLRAERIGLADLSAAGAGRALGRGSWNAETRA